jgi:hypothetical protein
MPGGAICRNRLALTRCNGVLLGASLIGIYFADV